MGDKNRFICTLCNKAFKTNWGKDRHLREGHGQNVEKRRNVSKYKCPICGINLKDYEQYRDHVLKSHEVRIQMHFFKFDSQPRFLAWKRKVEKETKSSYVKETKICSNKNKLVLEESKPCITKKAGVIHYRCHRSGYFKLRKDESERKRRFKAQGTAKINAFCPAKISAEFKRNGSVKVAYCSTHVGHECEISYLRLTDDERREIVAKIAAKIPFDVILDEIRNTAGSSNISRMHLLSKRDLWTISHSSYFKKYSQSVNSLSPLKNDQSNVELSTDNESLQDSFTNTKSDDIEEFEDTEIQTFDPNVPDSDSDMSSDCAEVGNNQLHGEFDVSLSSVIENQQLKTSNRQQLKTNNRQQLKTNNRSTLFQSKPIALRNKPDGLTVSQKQSQLIEKFRTNVSDLTSSKEIKWVENHINRMFILLKSMKERTEIRIKDAQIRHEGKVPQISNSIPDQQSLKQPSNEIPQALQEVSSQLFLPVSSPQRSKPKFDFQSRLVKCSPVLKTGQQKSICHSTQQRTVDRKVNLKTVSASKTQSSCSAQIKQYLVPIAGKPDKFLIVQTKPNEPPPVGPLTPVTPNQKLPNNKNAVIIDHSYSL